MVLVLLQVLVLVPVTVLFLALVPVPVPGPLVLVLVLVLSPGRAWSRFWSLDLVLAQFKNEAAFRAISASWLLVYPRLDIVEWNLTRTED